MKSIVVIPTYNEVDNVREMIPRLMRMSSDIHVLVVDDSSPDGTADAVRKLQGDNPRIHLLQRPGKMGLGSAYIAGFRYALERDFDVIFEMDADFSHDPDAIPKFWEAIEDHDVVLGSRYLHGVTVVNWPLKRLILSYGANTYVRLMTGLPVSDATGGFKAFRRDALEAVDLDQIRSDGYSFQVEMTFHLYRKGFRIKEIPIIFADRRVGISKMNNKIIWEAIWMVWRFALHRVFSRKVPTRSGPVSDRPKASIDSSSGTLAPEALGLRPVDEGEKADSPGRTS